MDKNDKDRYITIKGDKIHQHSAVNILMATDVKTLGITATLSAVFLNAIETPELTEQISENIENNLFGLVLTRILEPIIVFSKFTKKDFVDKCIDKFPDESSTPTPQRLLLPILHAKNQTTWMLSAYAGLTTASVSMNILIGNPVEAANYISQVTAPIARYASTYNRMNKLLSGEWVIVDTPKKEKVTETNKINAKPAFSM